MPNARLNPSSATLLGPLTTTPANGDCLQYASGGMIKSGVCGGSPSIQNEATGFFKLGCCGMISTSVAIVYSDNNFNQGLTIRNTNAGTTALTGATLNSLGGAGVGQFVWVPANYADATLANSILFSSIGSVKLAFVSAADNTANPDIYFKSGNKTSAIYINGSRNYVGLLTATPSSLLDVDNGSVTVRDEGSGVGGGIYASSAVIAVVNFTSATSTNFTANYSTMNSLMMVPGVAGSPSIGFVGTSNDRRTGPYELAGNYDIAIAGTQALDIGTNVTQFKNGSLTAPGIAFINSAGFGMGLTGSNNEMFLNGVTGGFSFPRIFIHANGTTFGSPMTPRAAVNFTTGTANTPIVNVSSGIQFLEITGSSTTLKGGNVYVSSPLIVTHLSTSGYNGSTAGFSMLVTTTPDAYFVGITTTGHFSYSGTSPTIANCGAVPNGAMISGTDERGTVQVGGGVTVLSCDLIFANPFKNAPACVFSDNNAAVAIGWTSITNTGFTVGFGATLTGGKFTYLCDGVRE